MDYVTGWLSWNRRELFRPSYDSFHYFIKYSVWFTWPAWPFAGWAVYAWRKQTTALHIALPLSFCITLTGLALCSPHAEQSSLIPLLPPLAILAAFGLPTMKRSAINAVDWFSVTSFSIFAIFIWLSWIGLQTGWPKQLHYNAVKSMTGFTVQFSLPTFLVALIATLGWLKLVHWRISRNPAVLWRAVVLSSSGVIMCWLLMMTLWMPWIDYRISYQALAHDIAAKLPDNYRCVDTNATKAQRASFAYFGAIRFAGTKDTNCDYFLIQRHQPKPAYYPDTTTQPIWQGNRVADKDERFMLYKKAD
jgi:4-amino-4-deoxy-L-arabinose transferase-like glycosyltransferase